jgi:hypothetical protein
MKAVVEEIYVAPKGSAAMERVEEVRTVEGRGIEGDRYSARGPASGRPTVTCAR